MAWYDSFGPMMGAAAGQPQQNPWQQAGASAANAVQNAVNNRQAVQGFGQPSMYGQAAGLVSQGMPGGMYGNAGAVRPGLGWAGLGSLGAASSGSYGQQPQVMTAQAPWQQPQVMSHPAAPRRPNMALGVGADGYRPAQTQPSGGNRIAYNPAARFR